MFVPPSAVSTEKARGLLPETVPHADAAFNAGRAALLIAALTGAPHRLISATEDRLHQSYRAEAMPESYKLLRRLRVEGIPAIISGAGPTVLAFAHGHRRAASRTVGTCTSWVSTRRARSSVRLARTTPARLEYRAT